MSVAPGARQLAAALNDVAAHRHPAHRRQDESCTCGPDPLRYLVGPGAPPSEWAGRVQAVLGARGVLYSLDEYLARPGIEVHQVRLRDREEVNRSAGGVWRHTAGDARHQVRGLLAQAFGSVLVWVIVVAVLAGVVLGGIVMFTSTTRTLGH